MGVLKCRTGYWIWIAWCAEDFLGSSQACLYSEVLIQYLLILLLIIVLQKEYFFTTYRNSPPICESIFQLSSSSSSSSYLYLLSLDFLHRHVATFHFSLWISFLFFILRRDLSSLAQRKSALLPPHYTHLKKAGMPVNCHPQSCLMGLSPLVPAPASQELEDLPDINLKRRMQTIQNSLSPHPQPPSMFTFQKTGSNQRAHLLLSWPGCGRLTNFTHTSGLPIPLFPLSGGFCRSNNWTLQNHDANPDSRWQLSCLVSRSGKVARKGFLA